MRPAANSLRPADPSRSAEKVKKQIEQDEGGKCHIVECDLMKHADCERVVKEHMDKYGKLNVLVNNVSLRCLQANVKG